MHNEIIKIYYFYKTFMGVKIGKKKTHGLGPRGRDKGPFIYKRR